MLKATKKLIEQAAEIKKVTFARFGVEDVLDLDDETFKMVKVSMEMYDTAMELAVRQAEIIESLDKKTNELLEMNKKLLKHNGMGL